MFDVEDDDEIECWLTVLWGYARSAGTHSKRSTPFRPKDSGPPFSRTNRTKARHDDGR